METCYSWQRWARRRDLTIGEFEDIWAASNRYEVARGLILALPEMKGISRQDKSEFLAGLILATRDVDGISEKQRLISLEVNPDKIRENLLKPALQIFFEIIPVWDEEIRKSCSYMLSSLMYLSLENLRGLESKVKKFVHSYLNSVKKEDIDEDRIAQVLIKNQMFEELVNYNFVLDGTIEKLWNFVFKQTIISDYSYHELFRNPYKSREKGTEEARKILLSWDKVENRHALATLWTLLAKRGDLEKIFGTEQVQK